MSVIVFPPTPQKTPTTFCKDDISTQILPLSRLSMSGSNCSVSPVANDADQVGSLILIFLKKIVKSLFLDLDS
jgi:hypothetical protein